MGPKNAGGMLGIDWCWGQKGQSFTGKVPHLFASARSTSRPPPATLQSGTLGNRWTTRKDLAGLGPRPTGTDLGIPLQGLQCA